MHHDKSIINRSRIFLDCVVHWTNWRHSVNKSLYRELVQDLSGYSGRLRSTSQLSELMNTSPSDTKYLVKAWSLNAISTLMKSGNESYSFFILPITRESIYGFLELWKFTQILIKQLWQKVQLENSKPEFPRKKKHESHWEGARW